jgi:hypothetical protein
MMGNQVRDRGTDLKITTHIPSTGPTCVSGQPESSMDRDSGCFASERPRFRFRDDGVVDIRIIFANHKNVHKVIT